MLNNEICGGVIKIVDNVLLTYGQIYERMTVKSPANK